MKFRQMLEHERVSSLPLREAIIVKPNTVVRAAIAMMRTRAVGCAVVVDHLQSPLAIFTERSVIELLVNNASLDNLPVLDYANREFASVRASDSILSVWEAIAEDAARFVCVTDDLGRLIGLTGQRGIAEHLADAFAPLITAQRLSGTPWMQQKEGA
jgi:CBS domain-containing protein